MESSNFHVDDVVFLKSNPNRVGIIDRTASDIDSHEPNPSRDFTVPIQEDPGCGSHEEFHVFLITGRPPTGTVLVEWKDGEVVIIPESKLGLLDRLFSVGDIVKKNPADAMTGTVISNDVSYDLLPYGLESVPTGDEFEALWDKGGPRKGCQLYQIPAAELSRQHQYPLGSVILYGNWAGRVRAADQEVTIRLANGSVVKPEQHELDYQSDAHPTTFEIPFPEVGELVKTKKGALRRGVWIYGAYDPNVDPSGDIVDIQTTSLAVDWMMLAFSVQNPPTQGKPSSTLVSEDLQSSTLHRYDRSYLFTDPSKRLAPTQSPDLEYGCVVRFKDPLAAKEKYDGSQLVQGKDGKMHRNKFVAIPRTATRGYDMNCFTIDRAISKVTVRWQDASTTTHHSTDLVPDMNSDDENALWPGEIVVPKMKPTNERPVLPWQPEKLGVVQSVNAADRLAIIRWSLQSKVNYITDPFVTPCFLDLTSSTTGFPLPPEDDNINTTTEEVSLYDIMPAPDINRRRGDYVIIPDWSLTLHESPPEHYKQLARNPEVPDWFGEIVDITLDGQVVIRLGALTGDELRDITLPPELTILAFSADLAEYDEEPLPEDDDFFDDEEFDYDDDDFDDDSYQSSVEPREVWYENEQGERIGVDVEDEGDWSTDTDDEMQDLDLADDDEVDDEIEDSKMDTGDNDDDLRPSLSAASRDLRDTLSAPLSSPEIAEAAASNGPLANVSAQSAQSAQSVIGGPTGFEMLEAMPPSNHHFLDYPHAASAPRLLRRISKEHKILQGNLPDGVYVRSWETRFDLFRVLIVGPLDTPYEFAPFVIDIHLPHDYPSVPPRTYFHSWTNGEGRVNPNLYEDGKICLSLLNT
jgi:ubiquitin-conjugating enzyme E2 O